MITTKQRRSDLTLTVLAGSLFLGLCCLPPTRYFASALRPLDLTLAGLWLAWRLLRLEATLRQWRAWHRNIVWTIVPSALEKSRG